jgi:hypothetical protein
MEIRAVVLEMKQTTAHEFYQRIPVPIFTGSFNSQSSGFHEALLSLMAFPSKRYGVIA